MRDYNDMICGICGVAPKLEIAQRYSNNVLQLKNVEVKVQSVYTHKPSHCWTGRGLASWAVTSLCLCRQFTWPEYSVSDEVHMDDFWLTMETEAIEQAIFPTDIPITRVDASIIAPFFPPLMRGPAVINTEKDKAKSPSQCPSGTEVMID